MKSREKTTWLEASRRISWYSWEYLTRLHLFRSTFRGTSCTQNVLGVIPLPLSLPLSLSVRQVTRCRTNWKQTERRKRKKRYETRRDETKQQPRGANECLTNAFSWSLKVNSLNSFSFARNEFPSLGTKMDEISVSVLDFWVFLGVDKRNENCVLKRLFCLSYKSRCGSVELIEMGESW